MASLLKSSYHIFVLSFIIILSSKGNAICPEYIDSRCTCSSDMYDCSNSEVSKLPEKIDEMIRTLDFSGNSISEIKELDASNLVHLNLANNSLKTLKSNTFDNLNELKMLVLSNNLLMRVADDTFEWNPLKLEVLHLDGNQIEFIQQFLFYDLEELTDLHLQNNVITFIHRKAFLQLKKLTKLRLDGNNLFTFNSKWFNGLQDNIFTVLNLTGNPWACDCTMAQKAPWLAGNGSWFSDVLDRELICQWPRNMSGLMVKDIGSIDGLMCVPPKIAGVSEHTTLYVNQSIELDCVVESDKFPVPNVMWIAPNKDHYNLQNADRFEGIEVFQNGTMIVHRVKLDDAGEYKCVATNDLSSVQATTQLTILENNDPSRHRGKVKATENTEVQDTQRKVDSSCPSSCTCVSQHVDCSSDDAKRGLTQIDYSIIPSTAVTVDFASNSIVSVPIAPEGRFTSLKEFRLDNNQINHIASHAFDNLGLLQTLTMRGNRISRLPGKLFRSLKKLTILVLDNNELTEIDDNLFYGLESLQWLYMRNNLISYITTDAFAQLPKVRFIHMEHNELTTFLPGVLTALTELKDNTEAKIQKIFVEFNQFSCDCSMNGLKIYLETNQQWSDVFGDGIQCSFPPELHDVYLKDIDSGLSCNGTTFNGSSVPLNGSNSYAVIEPGKETKVDLACTFNDFIDGEAKHPVIYSWLNPEKAIIAFNDIYIRKRVENSTLSVASGTMAVSMRPVLVSDEGEFTCQLTEGEVAAQAKVNLFVNQVPTVTVRLKKNEVVENEMSRVATCFAALSKPPPEMWFEDSEGNRIKSENVVSVSECGNGLTNSTLHLEKVFHRSDSYKTFFCMVQHVNQSSPSNYSVGKVSVKYPPVIGFAENVIGKNIPIHEEGKPFSVACNADGFPLPSITWTFKRELQESMLVDDSYDIVSHSKGSFGLPSNFRIVDGGRRLETSALMFAEGSETNNGTFTCSASNELGSASYSFSLQVYEMPTTTPHPTTSVAITNAVVIGGVVGVVAFVLITVILLLCYFISNKGEPNLNQKAAEEAGMELSEDGDHLLGGKNELNNFCN